MPLRSTPADWDQTRAAFATSLLADTPLVSLAQNLDGPSWPIAAPGETPSAYLDLNHDEALASLAAKGQPPERLDHLIEILRDTLAFDEPFGAMVAQSAASVAQDDPALAQLARLGIPETFPLAFCALSADTLEFCRLENVTTVGGFAALAQRCAQSVIVGGDFRALLNALLHLDEATLARYLPFRRGARGLHLVEAVALLVRPLSPAERARLVVTPAAASDALRSRLLALLDHFAAERTELAYHVAAGVPLSRFIVTLDDPPLELAVAAVLAPHLHPPTPGRASAPRKRGWFARLFKRT